MCVAIIKPVGVGMPDELFESAWDANPHGGGFMWSDGRHVHIRKGFMHLHDMIGAYREVEPHLGDSPCVLHFRIRTHGPTDAPQTHPHQINERLAFVHNGTISISIPKDSKNSDTMEFNDRILKQLPDGFLTNPVLMELIRGYVESSRLVFLDADKNIVIVNEQSGHRDKDGRWHSNKSALAMLDPLSDYTAYQEILHKRKSDNIHDWKKLGKSASKHVVKFRPKSLFPTCRICGTELRASEEELGLCVFCASSTCLNCGGAIHPIIAGDTQYCHRCLTDDQSAKLGLTNDDFDTMEMEIYGEDGFDDFDDEEGGFGDREFNPPVVADPDDGKVILVS